MRIGTRQSPLALAQAEEVKARLLAVWPELTIEIVKIVTSGDRFTQKPLADIGGKGLFTKEIEEALLDGSIDIAVHSMKDVPTELPEGLIMGAILPREDARDMLVGEGIRSLQSMPEGAALGTCSLRRAAQVKLLRPDIQIVPLRGNVQTRLIKLQEGKMAATLLAMAGLNRLGLTDLPGTALEIEEFLPAVAQGAIGIECRENDDQMRQKIAAINCEDSHTAILCERAFLRALDGSCRTPIAGYAEVHGDMIFFKGQLSAEDGSSMKQTVVSGSASDAVALGQQAAKQVKA